VRVCIFLINRSSCHYFTTNLGSSVPDCSTIDTAPVSFDRQEVTGGAGIPCDLSGATVTVTAIP
jgi:hypothetical protein